MNKRDVDELLRSYARKPVPTLPSDLEDGVWRKIRSRSQMPVHESRLDWLAAWVWRERPAVAFLAAAAVLGASLAWLGQNPSAERPISRVLELQAFSEQAPTLRLSNPYKQR